MAILKEFVSCVFDASTLLDAVSQPFKMNMDSPQTSSNVISQYLEHFVNFKISALNASGQNMSFGVSNK